MDERDIALTTNAILAFTTFGLLAICLFAFSSVFPFSWSTTGRIVGLGFLYAAAFFASGALIGFLFGIPRSIEDKTDKNEKSADDKSAETKQARYRVNTNLEEISDWLTKIIVGLGLINLKTIPGQLKKASSFFANSCGKDYCEPIALALIIYFSICGFFLGYLMTRLYLTGAFTRADHAAMGGTVDSPTDLSVNEKISVEMSSKSQGQMIVELGEFEGISHAY